jgi:hypothetical protein
MALTPKEHSSMKRLLLTFIVGTFGASVAAESYVCVTDQATGFKYEETTDHWETVKFATFAYW